jgi:hypothetical protein
VLKNVTITVPEEVAHWARKRAAEQNTSVSKLVSRLLEEEMRLSGDYWRAFERWKQIRPIQGMNAAERMSRDESHGRD